MGRSPLSLGRELLDARIGFVDDIDKALVVDDEAAGEGSITGAGPAAPTKVKFALPVAEIAPLGDVSATGAEDDDAGIASVENIDPAVGAHVEGGGVDELVGGSARARADIFGHELRPVGFRRESNEAKTQDFSNPSNFLKYQNLKSKDVELLRKSSLSLKSFYKKKVSGYLHNIENQKNN